MADHPTRDEIRLLEGDFYVNDPLEHYRWMRANAPVYRDDVGGVWGVTLHADIMHVSKNPQLFCSGKSSRPEEGSWIPSMINLDDPDVGLSVHDTLPPPPAPRRANSLTSLTRPIDRPTADVVLHRAAQR